ncbi:MAG: PAS domain S-box protein [Thermodesulfobacteriota bacterium]
MTTRSSSVHTPSPHPRFLYRLRSQILISFGLLFIVTLGLVYIVPTFGIPFTDYVGSYGSELKQEMETLGLVADLKKERLSFWLAEKKSNARMIGDIVLVRSSVKQLRDVLEQGRQRGLKTAQLREELVDHEAYKALTEYLQLIHGIYSAYHKIQVVGTRTGVILACTDNKEVGGQLRERRGLVDAMTSPQGISVDVLKPAGDERPYLIIYAAISDWPVTSGDQEVAPAVLLFYVDADEFVKPLLYAGQGLGKTGDIVLVNQDRRILFSLRYPLPDGTTPKLLEYQNNGEPARMAIEGREGVVLSRDYRGVPVLAAPRQIRVTPDVVWGMVVKRDEAEVFAPLWRALHYFLAVGLVGLLAALVCASWISNRISRPIEDLGDTARDVEAGNLSARAQVTRSDEVGALATAFNSMIGRVENWQKDLEEQVRARTVELAQNEERYRLLVENMTNAVAIYRAENDGADFVFVDFNKTAERIENISRNELLGRSVLEVFPGVRDFGLFEVFKRVWRTGLAEEFPVKLYRDERIVGWRHNFVYKLPSGEVVAVYSDETERIQSELALLESEKKFRLLYEESPVGYHSLDENGNLLEVNNTWLRTLGYERHEVVGRWFGDFLTDRSREIFIERFPVFKRTGEVHGAEFVMYKKDGSAIAVSFDGRIGRDEDGRFKQTHCVFQDITDRKAAEEALKESEERFRILAEGAFEGLVITREGRILDANRTYCEMVGYELHELIGKEVKDFVAPEFLEITLAHNLSGSEEQYESAVAHKSGRAIPVEVKGKAIPYGGSIARITALRDLTAKRKAEEAQKRLFTAIEQAAEGMVITDRQGTIQYVNPALERITGYTQDEIIGENPRLFKSGEHDAAFYKQMWETITSGEIWSGRIVNRRKDGTLYHEEATISPVRDAFGKITNFVAVKRDITEHMELSRQLLQAQKMEAIGTLAGGIAHDFNNLLQVILGYSELILSDEQLPSAYKDDLERINQAGRNGADLVQRMLTFSRKTEIKPKPLNLNHRISQVEKLLSRTIPKMIDIEMVLAEDLEVINADPIQMEQVIMNLAVNARDAMPEGGKLVIHTANVRLDEVYARTHLGARPGPYVLLSVSDTGIGMDKETLDHVFEPFFTTKGVGEGTGLGLATVYGIVKQHGGYIMCYSEPDKGTTFKLYFPALVAETTAEVKVPRLMPRGGSETVLLVDDEELVRDLGTRILRRAGYTVLTATNGIEALELYVSQPGIISLVILDLIMPEMGGKQCLEELLKIDPWAKVLVASGYAQSGPARAATQAGAKGFVGKPYDITELLKTVRDVLDAQ